MNSTIQPTDSCKKSTQIKKWIPGLKVLRNYQRSWLPRDLAAGLVLCTLLIPQGMAYAVMAGLPAITGLYATDAGYFYPTIEVAAAAFFDERRRAGQTSSSLR